MTDTPAQVEGRIVDVIAVVHAGVPIPCTAADHVPAGIRAVVGKAICNQDSTAEQAALMEAARKEEI